MAKNPKIIDMTGRRCGGWIVLGQSGNAPKGAALWLCKCDCGNEKAVLGSDLRSGKSKNCGCLKVNRARMLNLSHGGSGTRLHNIWKLMLARCKNQNDVRYGGRGISVCKGWQEFEQFRNWAMSSGYADNLSIDRVDVNKGYFPQNCRWANAKTQSRNRRFVALTSDGRPGPEVAEENGIPAKTYSVRRSAGWTVDEAATWPYGARRKIQIRSSNGRFSVG